MPSIIYTTSPSILGCIYEYICVGLFIVALSLIRPTVVHHVHDCTTNLVLLSRRVRHGLILCTLCGAPRSHRPIFCKLLVFDLVVHP